MQYRTDRKGTRLSVLGYGCLRFTKKNGKIDLDKTEAEIMEAIRSGGDLENLGGDGKYSKTIVCPDGCVLFRLTAKPLGNENFHKGGFWKEP